MKMKFEIDVGADPARLFGVLADLPGYEDWLPRSSAFHGTIVETDGPIGVGTAYREPGPFGVRHGRVTRFEPPIRLSFDQPMTMRPAWFGVVDVAVDHVLEPIAGGVRLRREVAIEGRGPVRALMPLVARSFRAENERMLPILKRHVEQLR